MVYLCSMHCYWIYYLFCKFNLPFYKWNVRCLTRNNQFEDILALLSHMCLCDLVNSIDRPHKHQYFLCWTIQIFRFVDRIPIYCSVRFQQQCDHPFAIWALPIWLTVVFHIWHLLQVEHTKFKKNYQ